MFKKPKRNFRSRKNVESDEEDNENNVKGIEVNGPEDCEDILVIRPPKGKKSGKKTSTDCLKTTEISNKLEVISSAPLKKKGSDNLLSFDEVEGEGESFKIKKSSHSRKVAKQLKREQKKEQEEKARLEKVEQDSGSDEEHNGGPALDMELDSDLEGEDTAEAPKGTGAPSHVFKSLLERGEIPDAHMIHAARKKRQQAREMKDFVPLESSEAAAKKYEREAAKSRLIREDEHDASADEEDRIDFSVNSAAVEKQRMRDNFMSLEHGSDEEGSNNSDRDPGEDWEEQQIRKAVGAAAHQVAENSSYSNSPAGAYGQYGSQYTTAAHSHWPASYGDQPIRRRQAPLPSQITTEQICRKLKDRLASLHEVHRVHEQEKTNIEQGLASNLENIQDLEDQSEQGRGTQLTRRFTFYQEIRHYTKDLLDCFNEKMLQINGLDASMMSLLRQRADRFVKRRQEDMRDEADLGNTAANKAAAAGGGTAKDRQAEETKRHRVAERDARRARRRRSRLDKEIRHHHEGLSSDDEESRSDLSRFSSERERLRQDMGQVFDDVSEDFCELSMVGERFANWRDLYPESYGNAYVTLCLAKLFSPLIKAQLLDWVPILEEHPDLEKMPWFEAVLFYGCNQGNKSSTAHKNGSGNGATMSAEAEEDDRKLLPSIVEKVLIPKLTALTEHVWDPLSSSQTKGLLLSISQLTTRYPTLTLSNKVMKNLLKAIVKRVQRCIDDDAYMPLFQKEVLQKNAACKAFLLRQFWSMAKLVRNILYFHDFLSDECLHILALNNVLNRYVMLGLQISAMVDVDGTLERVQYIVESLPRKWFKYDGEKTLAQLENLCMFIKRFSISLDGSSQDFPGRTIDVIKKLTKCLMDVKALDHASLMANTYSFRLSSL